MPVGHLLVAGLILRVVLDLVSVARPHWRFDALYAILFAAMAVVCGARPGFGVWAAASATIAASHAVKAVRGWRGKARGDGDGR